MEGIAGQGSVVEAVEKYHWVPDELRSAFHCEILEMHGCHGLISELVHQLPNQ
jgi:hypothetical protein